MRDLQECELAVLGSIKADNSAYDEVHLRATDFIDPKNRRLFELMAEIIEAGRNVDDMSIFHALKASDELDLTSHATSLPTCYRANVDYYAKQVREAGRKRRLSQLVLELTDVLEREDSDAALAVVDRAITDVCQLETQRLRWVSDLVKPAFAEIQEAHAADKERWAGVRTHFDAIDAKTCGFQAGDMIVIAARPSIGKTALALSMIAQMSIEHDTVSGLFSAEMPSVAIVNRLWAMSSKVSLTALRYGNVRRPSDFARVLQAGNDLKNCRILLDDTPNIPLQELRLKARQMVRLGAQILFVDYITLIRHGDKRMPRWERVGDISKELKRMARDLSVPVVALSQVGRPSEGHEPSLSDLRQSGEIEEDADIVMLLHREREEEEATLRIAKHRNGPTGLVRLRFVMEYARFRGVEI